LKEWVDDERVTNIFASEEIHELKLNKWLKLMEIILLIDFIPKYKNGIIKYCHHLIT
jgi:hypothetical protein